MIVSPVSISVKTAAAAADTESGTNSPIRMTINYYDLNGNERSAVYKDMHDYASSGGTSTDETITVDVLINNLSEVRSVEFEPYEPTYGKATPTWSIETVSLDYTVDGVQTKLSRAVGSTATETEPVAVNLSTVSMSVSAFSYNSATNASYNKTFTGTGTAYEGILIDGGGKITFTPTVGGSSKGASCECYKISSGGTAIAANDAITIQGTSTNLRSVVFGGGKIDKGQYKIIFKSVEFPDMSLEINIIVDDPEEKTTAAETTTAEVTTGETTTASEPTTSAVTTTVVRG